MFVQMMMRMMQIKMELCGDEIAGCQDATACNYNENATDDDSSCVFATGCDTCSGETDGTGTVVDE